MKKITSIILMGFMLSCLFSFSLMGNEQTTIECINQDVEIFHDKMITSFDEKATSIEFLKELNIKYIGKSVSYDNCDVYVEKDQILDFSNEERAKFISILNNTYFKLYNNKLFNENEVNQIAQKEFFELTNQQYKTYAMLVALQFDLLKPENNKFKKEFYEQIKTVDMKTRDVYIINYTSVVFSEGTYIFKSYTEDKEKFLDFYNNKYEREFSGIISSVTIDSFNNIIFEVKEYESNNKSTTKT